MTSRLKGIACGVLFVWCASSRAATPVILVPGFMGQRNIEAIGPYFYGVAEALREDGIDVTAIAPPPVAGSEERGAYLGHAIDDVLRRTGATHVIVIAHSQGGVDVRAAIDAGYAEKIAAVATLSAPHHGTEVADVALALPRSIVRATLAGLHARFESEQHMRATEPAPDAALISLSTRGMRAFNARHPSTQGVPFFSLASLSGPDVDGSCAGGAWGPPRKIDTLHPMLVVGRAMIASAAGDISNDGVVPTRSMRWGKFLGCIPGDHADWMGWKPFATIDHVAFLRELTHALEDVAAAHDARALDAHIPALARMATADVH